MSRGEGPAFQRVGAWNGKRGVGDGVWCAVVGRCGTGAVVLVLGEVWFGRVAVAVRVVGEVVWGGDGGSVCGMFWQEMWRLLLQWRQL